MKRGKWSVLGTGILLLLGIPASAAYLTDQKEILNKLTASELKIRLEEPGWEEQKDSDHDGIPDLADGVLFHTALPKDPILIHERGADAYGYMEIHIPRRKVRIVSDDNQTAGPLEETDLYSFQPQADWILLKEDKTSEEHVYVFGYGKAVLREGEKTTPLFEEVQTVNILEGTVKEGEIQEITVRGMAIQAENMDCSGTLEEQVKKAYEQYCGQKGGRGDEA